MQIKPKNSQGHFFILSFLPAMAYWYLEDHYSMNIAIIGGLILGVVEIIFERVFFSKVHSISKLNFILIILLGLIGLLDQNGLWFKLQGSFSSIFLGLFLLWNTHKEKSLFHEFLEDMNKKAPPKEFLLKLETHLAIFFFGYSLVFLYVTLKWSTGNWLLFKSFGPFGMMLIFFVFEYVYLRRLVRKGQIVRF